MFKVFIACCFAIFAFTANAQGWRDLDRLLVQNLAPGTAGSPAGGSFWLPDNADPGLATSAVGIVYPHIPGSAGSVSIEPGLFVKQGGGWVLQGRITGLYGNSPRDTAFLPDRIELTMTTLREGEARCCPTGETRWSIDRRTLTARALP